MHPATYLQAATLALVALTAFAQALDPSLLWGTYRPQIYFGLRTALPRSILSGLLWFDPSSPQGLANARHECSDDHKLAGYAWKYHDGRTFGIQEVKDIQTNYLIETSWLKTGNGSWAARVKGSVIDPSKSAVISPIYYFSLEDESAFFEPIFEDGSYEDGIPQDNQENGRLFQATIKEPVGSFSVRFDNTPDAPNQPYHPPADQLKAEHEAEFREARDKWHYLGARVPTETVWRGKEWVLSDISTSVRAALNEYGSDERKLPFLGDLMTLADEVRSAPNLFAIQRTFQGDFGFDVFFDAENDAKGSFLDGKSLTMALEASKEAYDEKLRAKLSSITAIGSEDLYKYARDLTSSIVGGIGYYFGQGIVDRSFSRSYDIAVGSGALDLDDGGEAQPELTEEHELLTATPSRSMFPRGFYWDEGFHLAHIGMLDNDVSLEIFKSWINLVDEDGWVAREQILGDEARSRVPEQFQTQYPLYANPPTLIMALTTYLDRINAKHGQGSLFTSGVDRNQVVMASSSEDYTSSKYVDDPSLARDLLADLYPKLRAHYMWFRKTQRGEIKEWDRKARARGEAFRWRGRTKDHVLTSGLDDYPRAPTPHTGELHLDLISWMGFFADTMRKLAEVVGEKDDEEEYERHYEGIVKNIDDLHWSEEKQMYCDVAVNQDDESFHVCHAGYISLFPVLLGLLSPTNPHLGPVLDLISDPEQLWSPYGIRSLSKKDPFFGQGENYWRGPIWIPLNFMALKALTQKYAAESGPLQTKAAKIYSELRQNLIDNTFKEYTRTGFTWEQFNPDTGLGQRSHPFTGWSSTIALIMAEIY